MLLVPVHVKYKITETEQEEPRGMRLKKVNKLCI